MRRKFRASPRRKPLLEYGGKPAARVIGWESGREKAESGAPRVIIPMRNITDPSQVPRSARSVWIVVFDKAGNPIDRGLIPRSELENYQLVP
jgi:hypothetical protein